jgi:hypothetical protein
VTSRCSTQLNYSPYVEQYDDDEGDRVVLANDSDLAAAIQHAKSAGWKVSISSSVANEPSKLLRCAIFFSFLFQVLRLHTDKSETRRESTISPARRRRPSLWFGVAALAGVGVAVYLALS